MLKSCNGGPKHELKNLPRPATLAWGKTAAKILKLRSEGAKSQQCNSVYSVIHINTSIFQIYISKLYLHLLTLFLIKDYVSYKNKLASF